MRIQADSLNTLPASRCNGKNPSTHPVSVETAFDRALQSGGIRVTDGSLYEAEPAVAIDLIEEVTARELRFTAPEATTHVKVTYTEGPDRFVSFSPRTFTEQDDYREFLCVELGRVFVDGVELNVWQQDELLAEAIEEWTLGDRRGE